ncbi:MAG: tryptophan--tRNA ligase [Clostridia bacterium]
MDKQVIYSGIQPTGCITLGNFIGAISNWLELQNNPEYQCIYSIVDMHSLTVRQVPSELRKRTLSFLAQYLACGLDPNKNILYIQSHVPAHAELQWVLNCFTYVGEMNRMTQFKDKSLKNSDNINMGLMDYPVLMASDILLYNTALVPIGIDQKQHLEIARDIAMRFNNLFSPTFTVPEGYIPNVGAKIMSLQNPSAKMSKSDENENATISLLDDKDIIMRKFRKAVTDSENKIYFAETEEKAGISNLLTIYVKVTGKTLDEAQKQFENSNYGDFKEAVGEAVCKLLNPVKERYDQLILDKDYLLKVARDGAEQANYLANKMLKKVHKKVGFVER